MSFKKLHEFNLALLGKQAWRLLSRPYLRVSRVFKARYFPNGSFFFASLGHNPSYVWRTIFAIHEIWFQPELEECSVMGEEL